MKPAHAMLFALAWPFAALANSVGTSEIRWLEGGAVLGDAPFTLKRARAVAQRPLPKAFDNAAPDVPEDLQWLSGTFVAAAPDMARGASFVQECSKELACKTVYVSRGKGVPVRAAKPVRIEDPMAARAALQHVSEFARSGLEPEPESAPAFKQLMPLLHQRLTLDQCLDMNPERPGEHVVCRTQTRSVLVFLKEECGVAFCGHVIYPMTRLPGK